MIINIIVYAEDEDEAVDEAKITLDRLCGEDGQRYFDYYSTFDEGFASKRWGDLPKATFICTDLGSEKCGYCADRFKCYTVKTNEILEEAMVATKRDFLRALGEIKSGITAKSDEELFEDDNMFKYWCHKAGEYRGNHVWLYDNDGEGIRNTTHLKNVLDKWACNNSGEPEPQYDNLKIYVVPADVHY